ncbi:MAG: prohibitin family protein, partial [Anaerolineales bacterium]|nr:prohibitin family protein [Anaerolineales bacterium]
RLRNAGVLIGSFLVIAILLTIVSAGLVFVQPTERGVVISALPGQEGVRSTPLVPGLNWVIPFFESVVFYPTNRQTYTMSVTPFEGQVQGDDSVQARTSDGQIVFIDASVIFAMDPNETVEVHKKWLSNWIDNLVRPQSRGIIRDEVAQFGIEEVYSIRRNELSQNISRELEGVLEEGGFILIDFVLRNITFSEEYANSVEQKQIAEQQAQQAVFVVEQRRQEAEQARQAAQGQADSVAIRAEGDARALLIQAQADADARLLRASAEADALEMLALAIATNPDVLTLEYIQRLSPSIRTMLLPSDNPFLLPLPDMDDTTSGLTLPTPAPTPAPTTTP